VQATRNFANVLIVKELSARERSTRASAPPERSQARSELRRQNRFALHDDRLSRHRLKVLAKTHDAWLYVFSDAEVEQHNMILLVLNHAVKQRD
jgi:hypothetical protein